MVKVMEQYNTKKPLILYISGTDKISKEFETKILTQDKVIAIMDQNFECLGLNFSSNEGKYVVKGLEKD